jgi:hypothetical protein
MTNDSDATPRRKTLSVKRPRTVDKAASPALRETSPLRPAQMPRDSHAARDSHAPRDSHQPRENASHEPRAGKLYALDDHMRRMQADMDKLGFKKD